MLSPIYSILKFRFQVKSNWARLNQNRFSHSNLLLDMQKYRVTNRMLEHCHISEFAQCNQSPQTGATWSVNIYFGSHQDPKLVRTARAWVPLHEPLLCHTGYRSSRQSKPRGQAQTPRMERQPHHLMGAWRFKGVDTGGEDLGTAFTKHHSWNTLHSWPTEIVYNLLQSLFKVQLTCKIQVFYHYTRRENVQCIHINATSKYEKLCQSLLNLILSQQIH